MAKLSKNRKIAEEKILPGKFYSISEASTLVKEVSTSKFDGSIDLAIRLGVDPRKANQMVRGVVVLPHGTGKKNIVLVLCNPDKEKEAKDSGADLVGLDEYIKKIEGGWTDFDIIITQPSLMPSLGKLGKILGPRGLMPNPKSGTVTDDLAKAIKEVKGGKIDFKVDMSGKAFYLTAEDEDNSYIAQANADLKQSGHFKNNLVKTRYEGDFPLVKGQEIKYMDVAPNQIVFIITYQP